MSTRGFTHYCEFRTLCAYAQKSPQIVPSLGQGPPLLCACETLGAYNTLTQRADNFGRKEGFMPRSSLSLSCPACRYRSCSSGFRRPWGALLSTGWELRAAQLSLPAARRQGWAAPPCAEQLWLKWWQGPLLKIKFCLIFCAVLVSHIRE